MIPRLQMAQRGTIHAVYVEDNAIRTADKPSDLSIEKLSADMSLSVCFPLSNLPRSIIGPLAAFLTPNLIQLIITNWLISFMPTRDGDIGVAAVCQAYIRERDGIQRTIIGNLLVGS